MNESKWVQAWGLSHSALSLFKYPSCAKTFRMVVNSAISGSKLRLTLSNRYGKNDVKIGSVTVAKCDENGNVNGTFIPVDFGGKSSFVIPAAGKLVSDEAEIAVEVGEYFCISLFVRSGDLTSGNLLDNVQLITKPGNYTRTAKMSNERRTRDSVIDVASKLLGMHFPKPIPLFDTVELLNSTGATSIVVFGDSISQQGFWTGPFEERIREAYPGRYSFINRSVMGNRLLRDCSPIFPAKGLYGIRATERAKEDVYPFEDMSHVIFFMGVNDIFEYSSINAFPWEKPETDALFAAIKDVTANLHAKGLKVIMFNIPAFGTAPDSTREKDGLRRIVNKMLEDNKDMFDGFYDVAKEAADPNDDYYSRAELIGDDKLHPNAYGGRYLAGLIDIGMFAPDTVEA